VFVSVVVAFVVLAAGFAVLSARAALRDVTRLSHVRDTGLALELYFRDKGTYPPAGESGAALPLGTSATTCLQEKGFTGVCDNQTTVYMPSIVAVAKGLDGLSSCAGVENAYCYVTDGQTFRIQFELEHAFAQLGLQKGLNCLQDGALKSGACPAYSVK
jgi:hypothetical protein